MGGDDEMVAKSGAGKSVVGYMNAGIEVGEEGTVGAGGAGSLGWQMRQRMEALLRRC